MKRARIRELVRQIRKRLEKIGILGDDGQEFFDYIVGEIEYDNVDMDSVVCQINNFNEGLQDWVAGIYPKNPDATDRNVLRRTDRAFNFVVNRLEKLRVVST